MIDLTKIDKPFGELDQVTQWALRGANADGCQIQIFSNVASTWEDRCPHWGECARYRLKPKPEVVERTYRMGLSAYQHSEPILSWGNKDNPDWIPAKVTVEWTDGVVTDLRAELG